MYLFDLAQSDSFGNICFAEIFNPLIRSMTIFVSGRTQRLETLLTPHAVSRSIY